MKLARGVACPPNREDKNLESEIGGHAASACFFKNKNLDHHHPGLWLASPPHTHTPSRRPITQPAQGDLSVYWHVCYRTLTQRTCGEGAKS